MILHASVVVYGHTCPLSSKRPLSYYLGHEHCLQVFKMTQARHAQNCQQSLSFKLIGDSTLSFSQPKIQHLSHLAAQPHDSSLRIYPTADVSTNTQITLMALKPVFLLYLCLTHISYLSLFQTQVPKCCFLNPSDHTLLCSGPALAPCPTLPQAPSVAFSLLLHRACGRSPVLSGHCDSSSDRDQFFSQMFVLDGSFPKMGFSKALA